MFITSRAVKIILCTAIMVVTMWLAVVGFTANQVDSSVITDADLLSPPKMPKRTEEFVEPNSPWRKLNLKELAIPNDAKALTSNITINTTFCQATTVKVFIRSAQPTVAKSQQKFLFLHGAAFTSDVWDHIGTLKLLAALGYSASAIDLPEHGQSQGKIGAVAAKQFVSKVQFMGELLDKCGFANSILVAPSMSGHYAIPFALTKPQALAGLVVVAPAASNIVPQSKLKTLQLPTLHIYGSKDKNMGPSSYLDLRVIPNFQSVSLPDASHAAYLDQPDAFHTYLYNFAQKLDKKP